MSDLAKWNGPVKSVKNSYATWDSAAEKWIEAGPVDFALFRRDGKVSKTETRNPDGSIAGSSIRPAAAAVKGLRFAPINAPKNARP